VYRLTQLALARKSVTLLLAAGVFVGGILAWGQLQAELLPDVDFPVATVIAVYPGAGTTDVAEQVSAPIERTLSGVQGVKAVRSTSAPSVAIVIAEFEYGSDMDAAIADIESSLATAGLPPSVEPQVSTLNINAFPVTSFTVQSADPSVDVGKLVRDEVVPELSGLPGVASVAVTGGELQRVEVTLDPVKLARYNVSVQQVAGVLQANEISIPSGTLVQGETTLPVTTSHRFTTIEQIRDLQVTFDMPAALPGAGTGTGQAPTDPTASPAPGAAPVVIPPVAPTPITLGDLGTVEYGPDPAAGVSRTNGEPSVGISVTKASEANTVDVSEAVDETMAELDSELGLTTVYVYKSADFVEQSIEGLMREGALGAAMAVLVIFLFLLSVRSTIVAAISIPLSVMAALLLMLVGGVSLNIMTLGGLAVAVGRVVDDAIVVLENIFRHHRHDRQPIGTAVIEGTKEVSSAITSSTITTVAVFLPIGLVGGLVTQFFLPFSLTVTFALLASLICALTVVPVLAYFLVPRVKHVPGAGEPGNQDSWVQKLYTPVLQLALRFRWVTLAAAALLFVASVTLIPQIPTAFLNAGSDDVLSVTITPPPGTTDEATLARTLEAEAIIDEDPDVETYQTDARILDTDTAALQSSWGGAGRPDHRQTGAAPISTRRPGAPRRPRTSRDGRLHRPCRDHLQRRQRPPGHRLQRGRGRPRGCGGRDHRRRQRHRGHRQRQERPVRRGTRAAGRRRPGKGPRRRLHDRPGRPGDPQPAPRHDADPTDPRRAVGRHAGLRAGRPGEHRRPRLGPGPPRRHGPEAEGR
jgi:HAE1 family hydrophobic/amphiphilic exporter-1